jgi:enoyl-CoA hydratase
MNQHVDHSIRGEVATVTLARPEAGNRLTNAMAAALASALDASRDCRAVVLRGAGEDFCVGRDMQPPAPGSRVSPMDVMREDARPMLELFDAFRRCRQPVIGLVQGRAWGIGTVFAALCDITLAASNASFRVAELERGIPPTMAMSALIDCMPQKTLAYLVYSAGQLDAQAALTAGLLSAVVEPAALQGTLDDLLARLLSFEANAVETVKLYLGTAPRSSRAQAALYGSSLLSNALASR